MEIGATVWLTAWSGGLQIIEANKHRRAAGHAFGIASVSHRRRQKTKWASCLEFQPPLNRNASRIPWRRRFASPRGCARPGNRRDHRLPVSFQSTCCLPSVSLQRGSRKSCRGVRIHVTAPSAGPAPGPRGLITKDTACLAKDSKAAKGKPSKKGRGWLPFACFARHRGTADRVGPEHGTMSLRWCSFRSK